MTEINTDSKYLYQLNGMEKSTNSPKTCKTRICHEVAIINQWGKTEYFINNTETPNNWGKNKI